MIKRPPCLFCQQPLPWRVNMDGRPKFIELTVMDPECYFCSIRCAARYGVAIATEVSENVNDPQRDRFLIANINRRGNRHARL